MIPRFAFFATPCRRLRGSCTTFVVKASNGVHFKAMRDIIVHHATKHQQILRFLITGGIAFTVNISVLYFVTSILHIYYLISVVFAFVASFSVSFLMQKFWTFKDHSREEWHVQFSLYLTLQLVNLALNAALMYMLVEYLHLWYILAQILISLGLAIISFIINRGYIFKSRNAAP